MGYRIEKHSNEGVYFLTFSVQRLYYIFDRFDRWDILSEALTFYIKNESIIVYDFVFMMNHIHLIVGGKKVGDFVRNFKGYTSKAIIDNLQKYEPNVLQLFEFNDGKHIWTNKNMPKQIVTDKFYIQKSEYIKMNPVKKSYVFLPEDWYWSSSNEFCELSKLCSNYFE